MFIADAANGAQDAIQGGVEVALDAIESLQGGSEAPTVNEISGETGTAPSVPAPAPEGGSASEEIVIQSLKGQFQGDGTASSEEVDDGSNGSSVSTTSSMTNVSGETGTAPSVPAPVPEGGNASEEIVIQTLEGPLRILRRILGRPR